MVMTRSKRAKRIVRCLSVAQHEDRALGCSTTPLIRYNLLHNYHRCIHVFVDLGEPSEPFSFPSSFDAMPKFLRSQLDAQKIADGTRLWSQVIPILTFIQSNLRRLGKLRGFPTLFVWYCRENHRSYFFFAFVDVKMVSKTYSARDLLRMKDHSAEKEFYDRLYEKLRHDTSFDEIFRLPSDRALPLIREEDAGAYGGIPMHSRVKNSLALAKSTAARQLDGTDYEWKYRGRSESDEDMPQPIGSPAGIDAQKDEGFQRFYKAVISPTHVRVTAGGRIVPNNRGASSPTVNRAKGSTAAEVRLAGRTMTRDQQDLGQYAIPQVPIGAYPHMIPFNPGMTHGVHPGMAAAPPSFPMMPWQFGPLVHHLPHVGQIPAAASNTRNPVLAVQGDRQTEAGNPDASGNHRMPPPEHFDHSRPFGYNGQWMMPQGFPYSPMPVAGFPVPMAGPPMVQPRFGVHAMMQVQAMRPDSSMNSHPLPSASMSASAAVANPPTSSIRKSEVTRRQLANLRQHLRYAEDQLQYNRHQIDEALVEQQILSLRSHIQMFENYLELHLRSEESQKQKLEGADESSGAPSSRDEPGSQALATSDANSGLEGQSVSALQDEVQQNCAVKEQKSTERSTQLPPGSSSTRPPPLKSALKKPRAAEPTKKQSTLPVGAALAPPFQPRTDGATSASMIECSAGLARPIPPSDSLPSVPAVFVDTGANMNNSTPYLVGTLPCGLDPAFARDTDYLYKRSLSEDELRARHMYWGNTPRNLQKGLPKFDGRDFYPPSPVGDSSPEPSPEPEAVTSPTVPRRRVPVGTRADYVLTKKKADSDPFGSLRAGKRPARSHATQSEHLPPRMGSCSDSTTASVDMSPGQGRSQNGRSCEDFRKALGEAVQSAPSGCQAKPASDSGDDSNILFKGRKNTCISKSKSSGDMLPTMLKKGKSSGTAVPGTVSSMTARGVLPNYAGHATASLSPAIATISASPKNVCPRTAGPGDAGGVGRYEETKMENRPPACSNVNGMARRGGC
ncbi:hypothetical protein RJ55_00532 [Drechmeria coniospora]|nr:hypothetical protein RJ55_00532 [Drechmeria coniospora]